MIDLPKQVHLNRYNQRYLGSRIVKLRHQIADLKHRQVHESEYLHLELKLQEMETEKKERRKASQRRTWHKHKEKYLKQKQRRIDGTINKQ